MGPCASTAGTPALQPASLPHHATGCPSSLQTSNTRQSAGQKAARSVVTQFRRWRQENREIKTDSKASVRSAWTHEILSQNKTTTAMNKKVKRNSLELSGLSNNRNTWFHFLQGHGRRLSKRATSPQRENYRHFQSHSNALEWGEARHCRLDCSRASENAEAPAGPTCGLFWAPSMGSSASLGTDGIRKCCIPTSQPGEHPKLTAMQHSFRGCDLTCQSWFSSSTLWVRRVELGQVFRQ